MRSSKHDGISLSFGNICTNSAYETKLFTKKHDTVAQLEGNCGINNVI